MIDENTIIIVDDGHTFEGKLCHWRDCFFDNANEETIRNFCKKMGWEVEFIDMKNHDLLPCPFYGSLALFSGEVSFCDFAVRCKYCKSYGPKFSYPDNTSDEETYEEQDKMLIEKAKNAWNGRKKIWNTQEKVSVLLASGQQLDVQLYLLAMVYGLQ